MAKDGMLRQGHAGFSHRSPAAFLAGRGGRSDSGARSGPPGRPNKIAKIKNLTVI